jgi:hypothetical protein
MRAQRYVQKIWGHILCYQSMQPRLLLLLNAPQCTLKRPTFEENTQDNSFTHGLQTEPSISMYNQSYLRWTHIARAPTNNRNTTIGTNITDYRRSNSHRTTASMSTGFKLVGVLVSKEVAQCERVCRGDGVPCLRSVVWWRDDSNDQNWLDVFG